MCHRHHGGHIHQTDADGWRKTFAPTGKSFKLPMCTVGRWNDDGTLSEEWLFWDNAAYMNQLGIG